MDILLPIVPSILAQKWTIISGHVYELGVPVSRRVNIYNRINGMLIATIVSGEDGYYRVNAPLIQAYTITSIDPNRQFNAVIQDNVVPK